MHSLTATAREPASRRTRSRRNTHHSEDDLGAGSSKSPQAAHTSSPPTAPQPPSPATEPGSLRRRLQHVPTASNPQLRAAHDALDHSAAGELAGARAGLRHTPEPQRGVHRAGFPPVHLRRAAERPPPRGRGEEQRSAEYPTSPPKSTGKSISRTAAMSTPSGQGPAREPAAPAHPPIRAPGRPPHTGILSPPVAQERDRRRPPPRSESDGVPSPQGTTAAASPRINGGAVVGGGTTPLSTASEASGPARSEPVGLLRPRPVLPPNHECDWKERYMALTAEVRHLKAEVTGRQQQDAVGAEEGLSGRRPGGEGGLEGLTIVMHMKGKDDLVINTDLRDVES